MNANNSDFENVVSPAIQIVRDAGKLLVDRFDGKKQVSYKGRTYSEISVYHLRKWILPLYLTFCFLFFWDMVNIWKIIHLNVGWAYSRETQKKRSIVYALCVSIPYKTEQICQAIKQSNLIHFAHYHRWSRIPV